jgi:hypothetical protein
MKGIPFVPGAGPFRCKGILYVDTIAFIDENIRGGRAALIRGMPDGDMRFFLGQSFLVGGWYDLFPLLMLQSAAAVATGEPFLHIVRKVARFQIPRQFRGLYKYLLKMASPDMMMRNLPRVTNAYFDFVRVEVEEVRPRTYRSLGCGVPAEAASAYMASTEISVTTALEIAGAREIRHRWLPTRPGGSAHGIEVVCVHREVSWA